MPTARRAHHAERSLGDAQPGTRVADIGCGPGRFAIDAARAGARITLVDISPGQLHIAREKMAEADVLARVDGVHCLDICDLSAFDPASFDLVLCYGGALSYPCERMRVPQTDGTGTGPVPAAGAGGYGRAPDRRRPQEVTSVRDQTVRAGA